HINQGSQTRKTPTPASPPPRNSVIYAALGLPPGGNPLDSLIPPRRLWSRQDSDADHSDCVLGSAATRAHTAKSRCGSLSARRTQVLSRRNAMSMKRTFYRSVAVIGLAGLLG